MGERTPTLRARGVTKVYRTGEVEVHAPRGLDLALETGELVVLLGFSGSGMYTLLNILGGLDTATGDTAARAVAARRSGAAGYWVGTLGGRCRGGFGREHRSPPWDAWGTMGTDRGPDRTGSCRKRKAPGFPGALLESGWRRRQRRPLPANH